MNDDMLKCFQEQLEEAGFVEFKGVWRKENSALGVDFIDTWDGKQGMVTRTPIGEKKGWRITIPLATEKHDDERLAEYATTLGWIRSW